MGLAKAKNTRGSSDVPVVCNWAAPRQVPVAERAPGAEHQVSKLQTLILPVGLMFKKKTHN